VAEGAGEKLRARATLLLRGGRALRDRGPDAGRGGL